MTHYADDFEMSSPVIRQLLGVESGVLQGKPAVRGYWEKALAKFPALRFELLGFYTGANSIVIHYQGHRGASAETFLFDEQGLVKSAYAHYA